MIPGKLCSITDLVWEAFQCDVTPQHVSAPNHGSENTNELLKALKYLSRDLICIRENFREQLSSIGEDTHELFGIISFL